MTHLETIFIVGTAVFASTFGVYVAVKKVIQFTRPPVNTLHRGDIELMDYIEPTQPLQTYYPRELDLINPIYERITSLAPSYETGPIPSYQSGILPPYQSIERFYINSWLENENIINLDFIFNILISFILGFIIFFLIEYCIFNFSRTQNKNIFTNDISTDVITFTEDYQQILISNLGNGNEYSITIDKLYKLFLTPQWTISDIIVWLDLLAENQDYAVTIEIFTNKLENLNENNPRIILSREFMVNNQSDPVLISKFISDQLDILCNLFSFDNNNNHFLLIHYGSIKAIN